MCGTSTLNIYWTCRNQCYTNTYNANTNTNNTHGKNYVSTSM